VSADNFWLVRRHPRGGFSPVMGFASDDDVPEVHHRAPSFDSPEDALVSVLDDWAEYGHSIDEECFRPQTRFAWAWCCPRLQRESTRRCDDHGLDCPDVLVIERSAGEFGLPVRDGGDSLVLITHCPWCGALLPVEHGPDHPDDVPGRLDGVTASTAGE
jgi:hypothetical protein